MEHNCVDCGKKILMDQYWAYPKEGVWRRLPTGNIGGVPVNYANQPVCVVCDRFHAIEQQIRQNYRS